MYFCFRECERDESPTSGRNDQSRADPQVTNGPEANHKLNEVYRNFMGLKPKPMKLFLKFSTIIDLLVTLKISNH
jgi:hypothetical protein